MKEKTPELLWGKYLASFFGILVLALLIFSASPASVPTAFAVQTSTSTQVNLTVNETISLVLSSTTINLPALTPGTPVTAIASATILSNGSAGWNLQVNKVGATTLASGSIAFPDATALIGSAATSGSSTIAAKLSFREQASGTSVGIYSSTTWGTADADPNALYAGFPAGATTYASTNTYVSSSTVVMLLRANAPATQEATNYTGSILITAIAMP